MDEREPIDIQVTRPMLHTGPALARIARGNVAMHFPADDLSDEGVLHAMLDQVATREARR